MSPFRYTLPLVLLVVTAGCVGGLGGAGGTGTPTPMASPTVSATATDLPDRTVTFPDGPKERPDRPATLNASSVREYVFTFEYRYAYNSLWVNEYTDVTLECTVESVNETGYGYEALVRCSGYSNTDVPTESTLTPGPHADWFTQTYRYRVSEETTLRERVSMEETA